MTGYEKSTEFTYPTDMKKRGWTDALIIELLGAPDSIVQNTYYKSGPAIRRYKISRVETAEATERFKTFVLSRATRRTAAKKAAETKRRKLMSAVRSVKINVPVMSRNKLVESAVNHYNSRSRDYTAYAESDPEFLERIMVNYLRHELTSYEANLESVCGKVGVHDARFRIREKVYRAISEAYPFLSAECTRQLKERERSYDE